MAAPPLSNNFEGGTNGTTVTTGNSGGASGNAFDAITIGASATVTFDNTHSRDSLALKIADAVSEISHLDWTGLGSLTSSVYFRAYMYITALPNAHWYFQRLLTSASGKVIGPEIDTAGKFTFENAAGTDNANVTTNAAPTNQWFRAEWRVLPSTTVGEMEWRLYLTDPEAASYTETKLITGLVLAASIDKVWWGTADTAAPTNFSGGVWLDNLAVSTTGWIGPSAVPTPPAPVHLPFMR